jgi:uncharacterized membrane protein
MTYLILGLVLFFGTHLFTTFRSRADGRDLKVRLGAGPYMIGYTLLSVAGLALIVWGFGQARPMPALYTLPDGVRHLNMLLMALAMILLAAAYLPTGYIKRAVKHPMLAAVKLWALGHLLVNGEPYSVLLFGSFLAYGVIDRIALKRRGDNGPGPDAQVSVIGDVAAVLVGLSLFVSIAFYLHPRLIGVPAVGG